MRCHTTSRVTLTQDPVVAQIENAESLSHVGYEGAVQHQKTRRGLIKLDSFMHPHRRRKIQRIRHEILNVLVAKKHIYCNGGASGVRVSGQFFDRHLFLREG